MNGLKKFILNTNFIFTSKLETTHSPAISFHEHLSQKTELETDQLIDKKNNCIIIVITYPCKKNRDLIDSIKYYLYNMDLNKLK